MIPSINSSHVIVKLNVTMRRSTCHAVAKLNVACCRHKMRVMAACIAFTSHAADVASTLGTPCLQSNASSCCSHRVCMKHTVLQRSDPPPLRCRCTFVAVGLVTSCPPHVATHPSDKRQRATRVFQSYHCSDLCPGSADLYMAMTRSRMNWPRSMGRTTQKGHCGIARGMDAHANGAGEMTLKMM